MFFNIPSFTLFIGKPIRIIRFLTKRSHLFQNRSVEFYFHASFPTSIRLLKFIPEFLEFKSKVWFSNSYLIQNWICSFVSESLFEFEFEASLPNYYSCSNSSSKLGSRILNPVRLLSFVSYFLFEFKFKVWFSNCLSNSHFKLYFRILI